LAVQWSGRYQRRELTEAIKELKRRTGASRVALVGNSRGGNPIRSYIKTGGGADVSHAVLCGVPNHGIYDSDDDLGSEFNGRGPFLRGLNEGESEVTPGARRHFLRARFARSTNSSPAANRTGSRSRRKRTSNSAAS
jgi:hypothetical protein